MVNGNGSQVTKTECPKGQKAVVVAKTVSFDSERIVSLSLAVREYVKVNGRGCPSGHLVHALGYTQSEVNHAVSINMIEKAKGKTGGCFPFGEVPETESAEPSVTAKAFDLILAISRGETVSADVARALWEEREALNAARRKA